MYSINSFRILVVMVAAVAAGLAFPVAPAAAHASLLSSDPADGETLQEAPERVVLEFSEELDLPSTGVALVTPEGETVVLPPLAVDGNLLMQDVMFPEPGTYTFSFRIVSADGHPVEGSIEFTVTSIPEGQGPVELETSSQTPRAAETDDGIGWGVIGLVAVAVLVVGGAGVIMVRSRRRS